jgi:translation initiation factor IF-3
VKVSVTFRGREITHKDIGYNVLQKFVAEIGEHRVDKAASESGRQITAVYGPLKK